MASVDGNLFFSRCNAVSRLMGSSAPSVNMNMAGMNMNMNMNMNPMSGMSMSGIGAACGMATENKTCSVQFPLHAQRRKRRVLFTQAQVGTSLLSVGARWRPHLIGRNSRCCTMLLASHQPTASATRQLTVHLCD
jgi:hypothetical protein